MTQRHLNYIPVPTLTVPRQVPAGQILAHNDIAHDEYTPSGERGFRWHPPACRAARPYRGCHVAYRSGILDALANNARISTADLARSVGLSPPSLSERIRRMEEAGVIEGYTLTINPKALGLPVTAWLRIRPIPGQTPQGRGHFARTA